MGKIAREVAEAEFQRFADTMELDVDASKMDPEDAKSLIQQREMIVRAIENGRMIVSDNGEPVYTPTSGEGKPITFYEPTGATLMAMDGKKKNADVSKLYSAIGDMTRQPPAMFSRMPQRDLKVCIAVASLFLAG